MSTPAWSPSFAASDGGAFYRKDRGLIGLLRAYAEKRRKKKTLQAAGPAATQSAATAAPAPAAAAAAPSAAVSLLNASTIPSLSSSGISSSAATSSLGSSSTLSNAENHKRLFGGPGNSVSPPRPDRTIDNFTQDPSFSHYTVSFRGADATRAQAAYTVAPAAAVPVKSGGEAWVLDGDTGTDWQTMKFVLVEWPLRPELQEADPARYQPAWLRLLMDPDNPSEAFSSTDGKYYFACYPDPSIGTVKIPKKPDRADIFVGAGSEDSVSLWEGLKNPSLFESSASASSDFSVARAPIALPPAVLESPPASVLFETPAASQLGLGPTPARSIFA